MKTSSSSPSLRHFARVPASGYRNVRQIRKALNHTKLKTDPDFEEAWIDASIVFVSKPKLLKIAACEKPLSKAESEPRADPEISNAIPISKKFADDLANRIKIGMLSAANRPPLCVSPDTKVTEAITLMLQNDYSQLPVRTSVRGVKGIVSWKSLGSRLALGKHCEKVSECMEAANETRLDASLLEAILQIVEHEFVLVRDGSRTLTGIVTTADLSRQFAQLSEPFLLLGQIENHVRNLRADKYTAEEFVDARNPGNADRHIEDVSDLTMGEYIRFLENPKHWEKVA